MSQDASQASLPDVFRSLNVAPDYKEALVRLAEEVSELKHAAEHEAEHQRMLAQTRALPPPPQAPPPSRHRHKREHPHLRLVTGIAVAAGGLVAALRAAAAFAAGTTARKAVSLAAGAAIAGGAVLAPQIATPGPAGDPDIIRMQPMIAPSAHGRHHYHHAPAKSWPAVLLPRRRRRYTHHPDVDATAPPDSGPAPSPSPPPASPSPAPSPTVSPSPAGQVIIEGEVMRGLTRLAWDDMPAGRSAL